ncbi:MAG: hypothetical protein WCJ35_16190 [Planctomycetota bacterium]
MTTQTRQPSKRRQPVEGQEGQQLTYRGRIAATPMSANQIRDLATVYLADLATRLLVVATAMENSMPPIPVLGVSQFGTATKGLEQLIELVNSAEIALQKVKTPSVRERLLGGVSNSDLI